MRINPHILCFVFVLLMSASAFSWWDESFQYRKQIIIENNILDVLTPNQTAILEINHSALYEKHKSQLDGRDIRVIYKDQDITSLVNISPYNRNSTLIAFKLQSYVYPFLNSTDYILYYGNKQATALNYSEKQVLTTLYDDFNDNIINYKKWTTEDRSNPDCINSINEEQGYLKVILHLPDGTTTGERECNYKIYSAHKSYFSDIKTQIMNPTISFWLRLPEQTVGITELYVNSNISIKQVQNHTSITINGQNIKQIHNPNNSKYGIEFRLNIISTWGPITREIWLDEARTYSIIDLENVELHSEKERAPWEPNLVIDSDIKYVNITGTLTSNYTYLDNGSTIPDSTCLISIWDDEIYINEQPMYFTEKHMFEYNFTPLKNKVYYYNITCHGLNEKTLTKSSSFTTVFYATIPSSEENTNSTQENQTDSEINEEEQELFEEQNPEQDNQQIQTQYFPTLGEPLEEQFQGGDSIILTNETISPPTVLIDRSEQETETENQYIESKISGSATTDGNIVFGTICVSAVIASSFVILERKGYKFPKIRKHKNEFKPEYFGKIN